MIEITSAVNFQGPPSRIGLLINLLGTGAAAMLSKKMPIPYPS